MKRVLTIERVLLTIVSSLLGSLPGSFMWALFVDSMSKNPGGWPAVVQAGHQLTHLTGWPAFGASWGISWLVASRPPQWWLALITGIAFGVFSPPLVTFVALWVKDVPIG